MDFLNVARQIFHRPGVAQLNHNLVRIRVRTVIDGLEFNICGLESSRHFNAES